MTGAFGTGFGVYIPLYIYLGMLGAALLSITWRPRLALYLLILLIPLQTTRSKLTGLPLGAEILDILWFSVLLGVIVRMDGQVMPKSRMNRVLIILAIVTYISLWRGWVFLGGTPPIYISDMRFSDWKNYMVMPVIAIVTAAALRDRKQLRIAAFLMVVGIALVDWSFFRSTAGRDFSHFSYDLRDAGVLGYAGENGLAAFVAQGSLLCMIFYFFLREKRLRLPLAAITGLSVYCLLFSFSRGGYIAFLAGVTFLAFFRQRKLLIGVVVLLLAWQTLLPTAVQERINMTYDSSDQTLDNSAAERLDLWQDAETLISSSPIYGTGFDTYQFMHRFGPLEDTHNYYVKVMVEMGAVGLLTLLAVLWQMWRLGMRLYRTADDPFLKGLGFALASVVVCSAVANLFGDRWTYLQVDGFTWVLVGCAIRGQLIVDQEKAEPAAESAAPAVVRRNDLVVVS